MAKPLLVLEEAIEEGLAAFQWYSERSPKAAAQFQDELDKAIDEIQNFPGRWPTYLHGTRFFRLRHSPFLVIFRETSTSIQVVAIAHGHRRQGYWKKRLIN